MKHTRIPLPRHALALLCAFSLLAGGALADEILLASGESLKGPLASCPDGVRVGKGSRGREVPWPEIDWLIIERKDFVLHSRVSPEQTRHYAEAFEQFSSALARTFQFKVALRKNWTIVVRIFRDQRRYMEYEEKTTGSTSTTSCGYFRVDWDMNEEEVVILDDPRDPGETFDTLLHEGSHLMLYLWGKAKEFDFPAWIDEGIAEYFGGSTYKPTARSTKKLFTQGILKPWRLMSIQEQIRQGKALSLKELFELDAGAFDIPHYGHAWSLIHFFAHYKKGLYARRLFKYCQDMMRTVRTGDRAVELFSKIFGRSIEGIEAEWREYVLGLVPRTDVDCLALAEAYEFKGEGAKAIEALKSRLEEDPDDYRALTIQARALSWADKYDEAFKLLDRALKLQPTYLPAIRSHAQLSAEVDNYETAIEEYARYMEQVPFDLVASIVYLNCLLAAKPPLCDPEKAIATGVKVAAYHHDAELLYVLGRAYLAAGKPEAAIERLSAALELAPEATPIQEALEAARAAAKK